MKKISVISGVTASLLLVGCGGGSSSSNEAVQGATKTVGTGYYVDAAVAGINYECGSQTGVTDALGKFSFDKEEKCTFKLGDIVLREINGTSLEDNVTIMEDNKEVAKLLQSFDKDGDPSNGIEILPEVHEVMEEQNLTVVPTDVTELVELIDKVKEKKPTEFEGEVVTDAEVEAHLDNTRKDLESRGVRTHYEIEEENTQSTSETTRPETPNNAGSETTRPETPNNSGADSETTRPETPNNSGSDSETTRPETPNNSGSDSETTRPEMPNNADSDSATTRPEMPNNAGSDSETTRPEMPNNAGSEIQSLPLLQNNSLQEATPFARNEILITFKEGMQDSEEFKTLLEKELGQDRHSIKKSRAISVGHIESDDMDTNQLKNILKKPAFAPYVKAVTPNYIMQLSTNDTSYNQLWAIENTGQAVNGTTGTVDADMDIVEAWEKTTGTKEAIVAVLDTGVDYTHSDLAANMWNGNVNHGYDFAADNTGANDDNPMPDLPYDVNGHFHGTHVAGIIGAVANNNTGVAGVAQNVSIMALKVFRPEGTGYSSDVLEALNYVSQKIDEGENIVAINASYGGTGGSQSDIINDVIKELGAKGLVFCAAAGNESSNNDALPTYPANYDATNIIAVAASDANDNLASFSNYGNSVDVAAPGTNILSTIPDNGYAYAQGTSMATPYVAGSIALLATYYPTATASELKAMVLNNVDVKTALNAKVATNGRVNINEALGTIDAPVTNVAPVATNDSYITLFGTAKTLDVLLNDTDADNDELSINSFTQATNGTVEQDSGTLIYTPNDAFSGEDSFSYTITDGELNSTAMVSMTVNEEEVTNTAPVATDDSVLTAYETVVEFDVLTNDSDAENNELSVKSFTQTLNGTLRLEAGKFTYTPKTSFSGMDSFEYVVSDGIDDATGAVSIVVSEQVVVDDNNNSDDSNGSDNNQTERPDLPEFPGMDGNNSDRPEFPGMDGNNSERPEFPGMDGNNSDRPEFPGMDGNNSDRPEFPGMDGNNSDRPEFPGMDGNNSDRPEFPGMDDNNSDRPEFPGMDDNNSDRPEVPGMDDNNSDRPEVPGMDDNNSDRPEVPGIDDNSTSDSNLTAYTKALAIPVLAPYDMVDGYKVFNLDINESTTEFFPGIQTKTYGINQNILGQTIRMHRGDAIKLVYNNNLESPTTMHGHGMHVPAMMDGGPMNKIQPNTTWTAQYTVDQKACTNWYHPHFMHKTAEHVYMGLAGVIIIDDEESDALDLPKEYGVDDIPLVLQDKRFDENGQIDYSPTTMEVRQGYRSDIMLANGVINPYVDVAAKKVRFRVLNGSNARVYNLEFSDGRTFTQIGTDNSFLEEPVALTSVSLSPGERADIVVDFKDDLNGNVILKDTNANLDIMKINVTTASAVQNPLPSVLTTHVKYDPANAVRTRKFALNMARGDDGAMHMAINGKIMDMARIDEVVPVDEIEIWEITNMMGMEHNFHIHATHFYPLERNGSPTNLTPAEHGYKDVIRLAGNDTVKVIVKMTDFTDDDTGYMYHCHFLEHEDDGMMGQFAVTTGEAVVNVGGTSGSMGGNQDMNGTQNTGGNQDMGGNQNMGGRRG